MLRILLVTARPEAFYAFNEVLSSDPEVRLDQAASGAEALSVVRTSSPHLAVIDFDLPDIKPLVLVKELLMVNAMVSTAVVSSLSEQQFHEASEGLGVLARLPVEPGKADACELMDRLKKLVGLPG
ncbi:MAG: response regulator [Syntrophobacteraceae bacterium]